MKKSMHSTKLNLVIGNPLTHSQSPLLHNTTYKILKINAILLAKSHTRLTHLISAIKTLDIKLTAVTAPFKQVIIPYLDKCHDQAKRIGAVNTVIQTKNKLYGFNTDLFGIEFALRKISFYKKNVLIIGAGGAARALGFYLMQKSVNIYWLNRNINNALILEREFGGVVTNHKQLATLRIDIIINTTPIGAYPNINANPLPNYIFKMNQIVFDMTYNPAYTQLLKAAKSQGAITISGIDMFVGQGIKQIELLTQRKLNINHLAMHLKKQLIAAQHRY